MSPNNTSDAGSDAHEKALPTETAEPDLIDLDTEPEAGKKEQTALQETMRDGANDEESNATNGLQGLSLHDTRSDSKHVSTPKVLPSTPPPPEPPSASEKPYLDPTPKTPAISRHPSV